MSSERFDMVKKKNMEKLLAKITLPIMMGDLATDDVLKGVCDSIDSRYKEKEGSGE